MPGVRRHSGALVTSEAARTDADIYGIRDSQQDASIIVIASDHGRLEDCAYPHLMWTTCQSLDGRNDSLYHSISSVNHFRYILDYHFAFNLGLLADVEVPREYCRFRKYRRGRSG